MNLRDFKTCKHTDRTGTIPAPELAAFFPKGKTPELIVRGVGSLEIFRALEAADRSEFVAKVTAAMLSGTPEAAKTIGEMITGSGDEVPVEFSRRVSYLVQGSVNPKFDQESVLLLAKNYPTYFMQATKLIIDLSNMNRVPGKRKGSGNPDGSEPLSP